MICTYVIALPPSILYKRPISVNLRLKMSNKNDSDFYLWLIALHYTEQGIRTQRLDMSTKFAEND